MNTALSARQLDALPFLCHKNLDVESEKEKYLKTAQCSVYASSLSGAVKRAEEIRPEAAKENRLQWNLDLTIEPLYNEVLGI